MFFHGFCGSGSLFFKTYEHLAKHVCLIFVDLIGMGCSDHPEDFVPKDSTPQECINYFTSYIEKWRLAFGSHDLSKKIVPFDPKKGLTNFILSGHSFGGYIAGNYALQYPKHIKKLILISPIGTIDEQYFENLKGENPLQISRNKNEQMPVPPESVAHGIFLS